MIKALKQIVMGALMGALVATQAMGQATLLPNASQQYFTDQGVPVAAGTIDYYIPGTNTRKNTWQDAAQTILNTNPVNLNAGGHPPATLGGSGGTYGTGSYRQVVKDASGNTVWDLVTTATNANGSTQTVGDGDLVGTIKEWSGFVVPPQYMFAFGQAIPRATYPDLFTAITQVQNVVCTNGSPTLTGVPDTTQIRTGADVESNCLAPGATVLSTTAGTVTLSANAVVSSATTARFFAWGNGNGSTSFNVPDKRGRVAPGRDNMGAPGTAAAGRLTVAGLGTNAAALGATGGAQVVVLSLPNLPPYTPTGAINIVDPGHFHSYISSTAPSTASGGGTFPTGNGLSLNTSTAATGLNSSNTTFVGAPQGGTSSPVSVVMPAITMNYIVKVTSDTSAAVASGVASIQGMTGVLTCGSGMTCTGNVIDSLTSSAASLQYTAPFTGAVVQTQANYDSKRVYASDFGVKCDGTTDDTTKLNVFFGQLGNISGIGGIEGVLPYGFCNFTSTLTLPVRNDFTLSGQGPATTLRYVGASTTSNLIVMGDGVNTVSRFLMRNFNIDSTTTMTQGNAIWLRKGNVFTINGVNCGQLFSSNKLWNCFFSDGASFGNYLNASVNAINDSIRMSAGVELNIDGVFMLNGGDTAVHVGGGFGGIYMGYVSILGQAVGIRVDTALSATSNSQLFISNRTVMDQNTSAGVYLADAISGNKSMSFQGWCSSATVTAQGCMVINAFANGNIQIGGGAQFLSNTNSAILYQDNTVNLTLDPSTALSGSAAGFGLNCTVSTTKVKSYAQPVLPNFAGMYSTNCNVPTLTQYGIMQGNGPTGQPSVIAPMTNGQILVGNTGAAAGPFSTGTGVITALGINTGTAGSFVVNGGTLGTPSSGIATNLTGTATGLTAGNVTTNANLTGPISSIGNATSITSQTGTGTKFVVDTSPVLVTPNLGVPSTITLTNGIGLPIAGISGLATGIASWLATPSSANLRTALTDETGTGLAYFQGGDIGTPSAGVATNITALNATQLTTGTIPAARMPALTGDTVSTVGTTATTVATSRGAIIAFNNIQLGAVNFNAANTDTTVTIPAQLNGYRVNAVQIYNCTAAITTATFAIFTQAAGAGINMTGTVTGTVTATGPAAAASLQVIGMTTVSWFNQASVFFRTLTPQGSAVTCSVSVAFNPM